MNFERMPKKSKWSNWVVLCLVLAIVGGTLWYFRENLSDRITRVFASTDKDPIPATTLERQPFSLTVSATGEIVGLESVVVNTPRTNASQLTIAWLVEEGTFVKAGDLIVRFDDAAALLSMESQRNRLDQNTQNMNIANQRRITDERNRSIELKIAEEEYDYALNAQKQDETIFSRWEIITAASDIRFNKEQLDVLRSRIRTQQRSDRSNQQVEAITRNNIQTQVNRLNETLGAMELRAPVDGMVLYYRDRMAREPAVGNSITQGQAIIEVINLDALQARINVLERDGGFLESGLPVHIRLDAVPDKIFLGVIRSVSSVATALARNSPLRYFTVEVTIVDAGADLRRIRPGMLLRGDIVLHEYESVFIVPSGAVTVRELQGDTVVHVETGPGRFETRVVELGMSSHGEVVILSGVEEGERVALVDPSGPRKLTLPDFNAARTDTTQPKGKVMIMGGPGGGGMMPGGMGGMGGMMGGGPPGGGGGGRGR